MNMTVMSGGKAIRVTGAEPAQGGPWPALILLHGAGGNVDFWLQRIAPLAMQLGIAVYAVHYFDRTLTTRATPAMFTDGMHIPQWMDAVRDALRAIATRPGVDQTRMALVGISLGAFLSLALAAEGAPVKAIVEISGGLVPPFADKVTSAFPPVLIVHGEQDSVVPVGSAHALQATLQRHGVAHRLKLLPAEGHWFSAAAERTILASVGQFLAEFL